MPIRCALVSVSDKTGIVPVRPGVSADRGVEILSTGGTYQALQDAGIPVITVESYTGSPEVMDGRVKTLHPRVHGGILMRGEQRHRRSRAASAASPIDLVVVNLYPFEKTVAQGGRDRERDHREHRHRRALDGAQRREEPRARGRRLRPGRLRRACSRRSTAKRRGEPRDAQAARGEGVRAHRGLRRRHLRLPVELRSTKRHSATRIRSFSRLPFERVYGLRYGENPHQTGAFYRERGAVAGSLARAESLGAGGKELSFNNLVDVDAALEAVREFEPPAAVVVKHTNPCGVATAARSRRPPTEPRARPIRCRPSAASWR